MIGDRDVELEKELAGHVESFGGCVGGGLGSFERVLRLLAPGRRLLDRRVIGKDIFLLL